MQQLSHSFTFRWVTLWRSIPFYSLLLMVDPMPVRLETSMVRHQSDAVGSDVRVGRVGWMTDILWISVCYQGRHGIDAALNWRQDTGDCPARFFRELMLAPNVMYVFDLYSAFSTTFTNKQRRFQFIKM